MLQCIAHGIEMLVIQITCDMDTATLYGPRADSHA